MRAEGGLAVDRGNGGGGGREAARGQGGAAAANPPGQGQRPWARRSAEASRRAGRRNLGSSPAPLDVAPGAGGVLAGAGRGVLVPQEVRPARGRAGALRRACRRGARSVRRRSAGEGNAEAQDEGEESKGSMSHGESGQGGRVEGYDTVRAGPASSQKPTASPLRTGEPCAGGCRSVAAAVVTSPAASVVAIVVPTALPPARRGREEERAATGRQERRDRQNCQDPFHRRLLRVPRGWTGGTRARLFAALAGSGGSLGAIVVPRCWDSLRWTAPGRRPPCPRCQHRASCLCCVLRLGPKRKSLMLWTGAFLTVLCDSGAILDARRLARAGSPGNVSALIFGLTDNT